MVLLGSLLVLYGYQDFEPIAQAYLLRERVLQSRICFLKRCGHYPWLEQLEAFYRELSYNTGQKTARGVPAMATGFLQVPVSAAPN